jgi:hypothetical protein
MSTEGMEGARWPRLVQQQVQYSNLQSLLYVHVDAFHTRTLTGLCAMSGSAQGGGANCIGL